MSEEEWIEEMYGVELIHNPDRVVVSRPSERDDCQ